MDYTCPHIGDIVMIKYTLSVAFVATTLLLAACEKAEEATPEQTGAATSGQATPAGQPAGTEGGGQLTEAEAKLVAEMEALQTKVDELQQEATHKTAETQAALVQQLNTLQHEREELKQKVDELSDTGAAVATNVLNGLNQSLSILTRSVEMEPEDGILQRRRRRRSSNPRPGNQVQRTLFARVTEHDEERRDNESRSAAVAGRVARPATWCSEDRGSEWP